MAITGSFLKRSNLQRFVSDVMDVSGPGQWKPHPDAYMYAVAKLGLQPEEVRPLNVYTFECKTAVSKKSMAFNVALFSELRRMLLPG